MDKNTLKKSFHHSLFINHNSDLGFSLFEVLIIVAIVAALFGVGFVNFANYRQRRTLNLTKQSIVAVLRDAQSRSISQESGNRWGVHFENPVGAGNDFYELFFGAAYNSNNVVSRNNLDPKIQFINPAAGSSNDVIFPPITGRPTVAASTTISLASDASVSSTIIIDNNGRIQY